MNRMGDIIICTFTYFLSEKSALNLISDNSFDICKIKPCNNIFNIYLTLESIRHHFTQLRSEFESNFTIPTIQIISKKIYIKNNDNFDSFSSLLPIKPRELVS